MNINEVKPDTSLYPARDSLLRAKARVLVAEAQDRGEALQVRFAGAPTWRDAAAHLAIGDQGTEYRVKPRPVVTRKVEWRTSMPGLDNGYFYHPSRREALREASSGWTGAVLIEEVETTYHDGVVVSIESVKKPKGVTTTC